MSRSPFSSSREIDARDHGDAVARQVPVERIGPIALRDHGVDLRRAPPIRVALWFKSLGHQPWFYYYRTGMIAISLLVYLFMRDTRSDSAMDRHE